MLTINLKNGETEYVFDDSDISVYQLPKGATADDLIQPDNSELRISALREALELNLSQFGKLTGFGDVYYKMSDRSVQTATQVVSENSAMFRRKKKHENVLESALHDLMQAVAYVSSGFCNRSIKAEGLKIMFDDSIIEDKESISNRALRELTAGVISPIEYRMIVHGETEENATAQINKILAFRQSIDTGNVEE